MSLYRFENVVKMNPRLQDLEFQVMDWRAYDYQPELDDSEDEYSKSGYYNDISDKPEKKYIIEIYGFDENQNSVCVTVEDFTPYFFLELPEKMPIMKFNRILERIKQNVPSWQRNNLVSCKIVNRKKLYGFKNEEQFKFARFVFKTKGAFYAYKNQIEEKVKISFNGKAEIFDFKGKIYESNIDPMLRFMHLRDISPASWVKIPKGTYFSNDPKRSKCNFDYYCDWKRVRKSDIERIGKMRILSFDIECTSEDGSFPKAERKKDEIIQIGSTCHEYGSTECHFKHIVTLKKSTQVEGAIVESYTTEKELLAGWVRLVERYDPDVITGYNIFGFDWEYIYMRAKLGMGNNGRDYTEYLLSKLSRSTIKPAVYVEKNLSSSALGDNFLRYVDCPGRIPIDMFKLVQRDFKLGSYKLDNVAEHFLGVRKIDLKPHQIFTKYQSGKPEEIGEIAEYCIRDCELCNKLIVKLETIASNVAMANVCTVPFSYLFLRGQGVKIFSLVAKQCQKEGYLIKVVEKPKEQTGYEGAIVFTPKPQICMDPITVLDYGSLYPSSMISENLSHDTLVDDPRYLNLPNYNYNRITYDIFEGKGDDKKKVGEKTSIFAEKKNGEKGILPRILEGLLSARKSTRAKIPHKTIVLNGGEEYTGFLKEIDEEKYKIITEKKEEIVVNKKAVKDITDTYTDFQKAMLDGRQLALKVTANSLYGQCGAGTSPIFNLDIAASTTATGRGLVILARDKITEKFKGTKSVYGDSVTGDTPLLLLNPMTNEIEIKTIETLSKEWKPYQEFKPWDTNRKEKQQSETKYQVWSDQGWTPIKRVIRHKCHKKIYRVSSPYGMVNVTEDHSLLDKDKNKIKPTELMEEIELLHSFPTDIKYNYEPASKFELYFSTYSQEEALKWYCHLKLENPKMYVCVSMDKDTNEYVLFCPTDNHPTKNIIDDLGYLPEDEFVYDLETEIGRFHAGIGELIVKNTDSVFLNFVPHIEAKYGKDISDQMKLEKSLELGLEAEKYMGTLLKKPHKCEYEKIFYPFIIFSKKRYVGNKYEFDMNKYKQTSMGIVLKRRDNAPIVKEIYGEVIKKILNDRDQDAAKQYFKESVIKLLNGEVDINTLIISKSLSANYANPTQIAHKVLADRIGERDPGNKPQSNDRIPFCYIDFQELECDVCHEKKLNRTNCKCTKCMKLFCPSHIRHHKNQCREICRFCRATTKEADIKQCNICHGWYCRKDMIKHHIRKDKYGKEHNDKCKKELQPKLLQGDIIEHPDYIKEHNIKIDYRYYLDHQIKTPCLQIFELMMDDPESLIRAAVIKDNNEKEGNQAITNWFKVINNQ